MVAARLSEVVKYMKTLRAAQHLDLALPSMTEVYPRYQRSSPDMQV